MTVQADQERWDEKYRSRQPSTEKKANPFLRKHIRFLPPGKALDLACGEGQNAVFLAGHGFEVEALDISPAALMGARKLARDSGVGIRTIRADLDSYRIEKGKYDLITSFYFLDRKLIPSIKEALKEGAKIVLETYLVEQKDLGGPRNPAYLLKPNELLRLFRDFRVLFFREGIFREGGSKKAIASIIAAKK